MQTLVTVVGGSCYSWVYIVIGVTAVLAIIIIIIAICCIIYKAKKVRARPRRAIPVYMKPEITGQRFENYAFVSDEDNDHRWGP